MISWVKSFLIAIPLAGMVVAGLLCYAARIDSTDYPEYSESSASGGPS